MTIQIKILGTGCCSACSDLHQMVARKISEMGLDAVIIKSDDIMELAKAGVMSTPAVVIEGKVVHAGGLPKEADIDKWFK